MTIDIPAVWEWSASQIEAHRWRKVLVMGDVDRGKSTYCDFLSQHLLTAGFRVAVVDTDVGQKHIGPPATLTLGYPAPAQPLADVRPVAWYFIGAVNPVGHLLPMVVGTRQLVDTARGAFVLMNTTGFIRGVGRILKSYKIEAVQPDVIVAIAQGSELQPIIRAYRNYRILRLPPSPRAVVKTPEQRRQARERAFGNYFQPACEIALPYRKLILQRKFASPDSKRNLLCGLADRRNRGLGLAIVRAADASRGTFSLLTPVPAEKIHLLQYGDLYLSPDGHELGRD